MTENETGKLDKSFPFLLGAHTAKALLAVMYVVVTVFYINTLSRHTVDLTFVATRPLEIIVTTTVCHVEWYGAALVDETLAGAYAVIKVHYASVDTQPLPIENTTAEIVRFEFHGGDEAVGCRVQIFLPKLLRNLTVGCRGGNFQQRSLAEVTYPAYAFIHTTPEVLAKKVHGLWGSNVDVSLRQMSGMRVDIEEGMVRVDLGVLEATTLHAKTHLSTMDGDVSLSVPSNSVMASIDVQGYGYCLAARNMTVDVTCTRVAVKNGTKPELRCRGTAFLCTTVRCRDLLRVIVRGQNVYVTVAAEAKKLNTGRIFNGTVDFDMKAKAELAYTKDWASTGKGADYIQSINVRGQSEVVYLHTNRRLLLELDQGRLSLLTFFLMQPIWRRMELRLSPGMCPYQSVQPLDAQHELEKQILRAIQRGADPANEMLLNNNLAAVSHMQDSSHTFFWYVLEKGVWTRQPITASFVLQAAIAASIIVALLCVVVFLFLMWKAGPNVYRLLLRQAERRLNMRIMITSDVGAVTNPSPPPRTFFEDWIDRGPRLAVMDALVNVPSLTFLGSSVTAWFFVQSCEDSLLNFMQTFFEVSTDESKRVAMHSLRNEYQAFCTRYFKRILDVADNFDTIKKWGASVQEISDANTDAFLGITYRTAETTAGAVKNAKSALPMIAGSEDDSLWDFVDAEMTITGRDVDFILVAEFIELYRSYCRMNVKEPKDVTGKIMSTRGVNQSRLTLPYVIGLVKRTVEVNRKDGELITECVKYTPVCMAHFDPTWTIPTHLLDMFVIIVIVDVLPALLLVLVFMWEQELGRYTSASEYENHIRYENMRYFDILNMNLFLVAGSSASVYTYAAMMVALSAMFLGRVEVVFFFLHGYTPLLASVHEKIPRETTPRSWGYIASLFFFCGEKTARRVWLPLLVCVRMLHISCVVIMGISALWYFWLGCVWIVLGAVISPDLMLCYAGTVAAVGGTAATLYKSLSGLYEATKKQLEDEIARQMLRLVETSPLASQGASALHSAKVGKLAHNVLKQRTNVSFAVVQALSQGEGEAGMEAIAAQLDVPICAVAMVVAAVRRDPADVRLAFQHSKGYVDVPDEVVSILAEVVVMAVGKNATMNYQAVLGAFFKLYAKEFPDKEKEIRKKWNITATLVQLMMPPLLCTLRNERPDVKILVPFLDALINAVSPERFVYDDLHKAGASVKARALLPQLMTMFYAFLDRRIEQMSQVGVEIAIFVQATENFEMIKDVISGSDILHTVLSILRGDVVGALQFLQAPFLKQVLRLEGEMADHPLLRLAASEGQPPQICSLFFIFTAFVANVETVTKALCAAGSEESLALAVRFVLFRETKALTDFPANSSLTAGVKSCILSLRRFTLMKGDPQTFAGLFTARISDIAGHITWVICYSKILQRLEALQGIVVHENDALMNRFPKYDWAARVDFAFFRQKLMYHLRLVVDLSSTSHLVDLLLNDNIQTQIANAARDVVFRRGAVPHDRLEKLFQPHFALLSKDIRAALPCLHDLAALIVTYRLGRYVAHGEYFSLTSSEPNFNLDDELRAVLKKLSRTIVLDPSRENSADIALTLIKTVCGDLSGLLVNKDCNALNTKLFPRYDHQLLHFYIVSAFYNGQLQLMKSLLHAEKSPEGKAIIAAVVQSRCNPHGFLPLPVIKDVLTKCGLEPTGKYFPRTLHTMLDTAAAPAAWGEVLVDLERSARQGASIDYHLVVLDAIYSARTSGVLRVLRELQTACDGTLPANFCNLCLHRDGEREAYKKWAHHVKVVETNDGFLATRALCNIMLEAEEVTASIGNDLWPTFVRNIPNTSMIVTSKSLFQTMKGLTVSVLDDILVPTVKVTGSAMDHRKAAGLRKLFCMVTTESEEKCRALCDLMSNGGIPTGVLPADVAKNAKAIHTLLQLARGQFDDATRETMFSYLGINSDTTYRGILQATLQFRVPPMGVRFQVKDVMRFFIKELDLDVLKVEEAQHAEEALYQYYERDSKDVGIFSSFFHKLREVVPVTATPHHDRVHAMFFLARALMQGSPMAPFFASFVTKGGPVEPLCRYLCHARAQAVANMTLSDADMTVLNTCPGPHMEIIKRVLEGMNLVTGKKMPLIDFGESVNKLFNHEDAPLFDKTLRAAYLDSEMMQKDLPSPETFESARALAFGCRDYRPLIRHYVQLATKNTQGMPEMAEMTRTMQALVILILCREETLYLTPRLLGAPSSNLLGLSLSINSAILGNYYASTDIPIGIAQELIQIASGKFHSFAGISRALRVDPRDLRAVFTLCLGGAVQSAEDGEALKHLLFPNSASLTPEVVGHIISALRGESSSIVTLATSLLPTDAQPTLRHIGAMMASLTPTSQMPPCAFSMLTLCGRDDSDLQMIAGIHASLHSYLPDLPVPAPILTLLARPTILELVKEYNTFKGAETEGPLNITKMYPGELIRINNGGVGFPFEYLKTVVGGGVTAEAEMIAIEVGEPVVGAGAVLSGVQLGAVFDLMALTMEPTGVVGLAEKVDAALLAFDVKDDVRISTVKAVFLARAHPDNPLPVLVKFLGDLVARIPKSLAILPMMTWLYRILDLALHAPDAKNIVFSLNLKEVLSLLESKPDVPGIIEKVAAMFGLVLPSDHVLPIDIPRSIVKLETPMSPCSAVASPKNDRDEETGQHENQQLQPGDTVTLIVSRNPGATIESFRKANEGIGLPSGNDETFGPEVTTVMVPVYQPHSVTYEVKPGDTVAHIMTLHAGATVEAFRKDNEGLPPGDDELIPPEIRTVTVVIPALKQEESLGNRGLPKKKKKKNEKLKEKEVVVVVDDGRFVPYLLDEIKPFLLLVESLVITKGKGKIPFMTLNAFMEMLRKYAGKDVPEGDIDSLQLLVFLLQGDFSKLSDVLLRLGIPMTETQRIDFVAVMNVVVPIAQGMKNMSVAAEGMHQVKEMAQQHIAQAVDNTVEMVNERIFSIFDVDNSSTLDFQEFSYVVGAMNIYLTEHEIRTLFLESDTDEDELLTVFEFHIAMKNLRAKILERMMVAMKISKTNMIFIVLYTMLILSLLLAFILLGVMAFTPGTSFTAVINTTLTMGLGGITSLARSGASVVGLAATIQQLSRRVFQQIGPPKQDKKQDNN